MAGRNSQIASTARARGLMSYMFDNETETQEVADDRSALWLLMEVVFVHVLHDRLMQERFPILGGPTMTSEQVSDGLAEVRHEGSFVRRNRGCDMPFMQRVVVGGLNRSGSPFGVRCSRVYRELYMRIASSMRIEDSSSDDDSTTAEEEERSDDEVLGPN
jgi:hypothetical protein